jgi:hypothetical protein
MDKKDFATERDIFKIASVLIKEFEEYNLSNMEVKIGLPSYKLKKLDEFLFKKFNPNAHPSQFVSQEEVKISLGDINFILYKNNDQEEPQIKVDENGNEYIN